jgi:hypothetical protein
LEEFEGGLKEFEEGLKRVWKGSLNRFEGVWRSLRRFGVPQTNNQTNLKPQTIKQTPNNQTSNLKPSNNQTPKQSNNKTIKQSNNQTIKQKNPHTPKRSAPVPPRQIFFYSTLYLKTQNKARRLQIGLVPIAESRPPIAKTMKIVHVILSGGVGSRLWPVSRKSMPKQYIPMFREKSLFQLTAERSKSLVDQTLIVGNKDNYLLSQADLMRAGVGEFTEIIEAAPRNTAAAIAFAALAVQPDDILLVTPSDHIITDEKAYEAALTESIELAKQGYLVTFGITPTKPETGYGYIEYSGKLPRKAKPPNRPNLFKLRKLPLEQRYVLFPGRYLPRRTGGI